jgi:CHAT domain-containing protein/Flp pilus assembly protein TadD
VIEEDGHLSIEQIELLLAEPSESVDRSASSELIEQAQRHLKGCERCQGLLSMHKGSNDILRKLHVEISGEPGEGCPSLTSLYAFAGGLLKGEEASQLFEHVADCDHCAPLLRRATEVLSEEVTPEEGEMIASLRSSDRDHQAALARRLASSNVTDREVAKLLAPVRGTGGHGRRPLSLRWAVAIAATFVVLASAGVWEIWRSSPSRVNVLLSRAYGERRTLELRFPEGPYSAFQVTRGRETSSLDRSPTLLEAESVIGRKLSSKSNDPVWLQAKGRADILDGNYEAAIATLEKAQAATPNSPDILRDLASAYFERAEAAGRSQDYGTSYELLSLALQRRSEDPVALFNRAIVGERLNLFQQAVDDWERYLKMDASSPWATEAREHLTAIRKKLKLRDQSLAQPLLSPSVLASLSAEDTAEEKRVDQRIEEYLHLAVREWLEHAFPAGRGQVENQESYRSALLFLAVTLKKVHRDPWLADLLSNTRSRSFSLGIEALSKAVSADDRGDYEPALEEARDAEKYFRAAENEAGYLRAAVERTYALHLSHTGDACLEAIRRYSRDIDDHSYPWLRIQFHIEEGICEGLMGRLGASRQALHLIRGETEQSKYPLLYLRLLGNISEMDTAIGDPDSGWAEAQEGLSLYWAESVPPMQGYNLHLRLYDAAGEVGRPNLQVAIWSQAVNMIDGDEDFLLRAMAHSKLANCALAADLPKVAASEFKEAERLFFLAPQSATTGKYRVEAGTELAVVEARNGRSKEALSLLEQLKPEVDRLSDNYVALEFHAALGHVLAATGDSVEAGRAFESSLRLAETSLVSLGSAHDRVTWDQETSGVYRDFVEWKIRQGDSTGALEAWEWYLGSELRATDGTTSAGRANSSHDIRSREKGEWPRLDEVRSRLASLRNETVLSYALFPTGLAIWSYDSRGIAFRWVEVSSARVDHQVSRFVEECSDSKSDQRELAKDSRDLYDLLVEPIEGNLLPGSSLLVELDGSLTDLPFDALRSPKGLYLSEEFPVAVSPGLYFQVRQAAETSISSGAKALVVGVARSSSESAGKLASLSDAEDEAQSVAAEFSSSTLLTARRATLGEVLTRLPSATVFHFAGHGVASSDESGLVLSDKLLTSEHVKGLRINSLQLAFLAACDTELANTGANSHYNGLARSFLRQGVHRVVASRWNVDSRATRAYVSDFYRDLLCGKTVSQSIQGAQTAVRSRAETSHPYYWASFKLFGLA